MVIYIFLILSIINFVIILNLKKENQKLKKQYKICWESIQFLKNKIGILPLEEQTKENQTTPEIVQSLYKNVKPPKTIYKNKKINFESLFGKNIVGILASVLIFIGIATFGILIFNKISNNVKILFLFVASFGMTGLGLFLHDKNKNTFTISLAGCGIGSIFISIFITHLYFKSISDITAFGLIFTWALITLLISIKIKSSVLIYVANIGSIISILLGIGYGNDKILELTIYQLLTMTLLLIIDYKYSKILFKLSTYFAFIANIILSFYSIEFIKDFNNFIPLIIISVLAIYNFMLYYLNNLVDIKNNLIENIISNLILFFTIFAGLHYCIHDYLYKYLDVNLIKMSYLLSIKYSTLIIVLILIGFGIIIKNCKMIKGYTISSFVYTALCLLIFNWEAFYSNNNLVIWIFLLTYVLYFIYYKTSKLEYFYLGLSFLIIESIFSIRNFYETEYLSIIYSLVLLLSFIISGYVKEKNIFKYLNIIIIFININLFISLTESISKYALALIIITTLNIIIKFISNKNYDSFTKIIMIISEILLISFNSLFITLETPTQNTSEMIYLIILSFVTLLLGMIKLKEIIDNKQPIYGIWYGLKFTWLIIHPLTQFTTFLNEQFVFSIVCMLIAFICILFGFRFKIKSARIYGLLIIISSVLKIVVLDMWSQNSIIRVISLILGGIICFTISAGYNYFDNKIIKK